MSPGTRDTLVTRHRIGLIPLLLAAAAVQDSATLRLDRPVQGRITSDSPAINSRSLQRRFGKGEIRKLTFTVEVDAAGDHAIVLASKAFDPWLVVRDPKRRILAQVAASREHAATVVVRIEPADRLRVEVHALRGQSGGFKLSCEAATPHNRGLARLARLRAAVASAERGGKDSEQVLQALNALAVELFKQGRLTVVEQILRRSLALCEKLYGHEHPEVAQVLNNLAFVLRDKGKYAAGVPLFRRAIAIFEKSHGKEHPNVARCVYGLAELFRFKGEHAAAEPLYKRSVAMREKVLGPEHPLVGVCLNGLAELYRAMDRHEEAEPLYRRVLAIVEKAFGPEHEEVATSVNNLALLLNAMGRYSEAEPLSRRALAITEKVLGSYHPAVAVRLNNLGMLLGLIGRCAEAEPLYRRALAVYQRAYGAEHPDVALVSYNLAGLLFDLGRFAAAERLYRRSLAIREKVYGPVHPNVAITLAGLAGLLRDKGELRAAERLGHRALAIREKVLGKRHTDTASSLAALGLLHEFQGQLEDAEPLYLRALATLEDLLGPDHPRVGNALSNLACLYSAQRRYAKAEPLFRRGLAIREKAFGSEHVVVARNLHNLARMLSDRGDFEAAEPIYRRSLTIAERLRGPAHPDVATCIGSLVALAASVGDGKEAWRLSLKRCEGGSEHLVDELTHVPADGRFALTARHVLSLDLVLSCLALVDEPDAADVAWQQITAWKGIVFRLGKRLAAAEPPPAVKALRDRLRSLSTQLSRAAYTRGIGDLAAHRSRTRELLDERRRVQGDLMARLGIEIEREHTNARELGRLLPDRSALADFIVHHPQPLADKEPSVSREKMPTRVLCFLVRAGATQPVLVDLGDAASLHRLVRRWLASLAQGALDPRGPPGESLEKEAGVARRVRDRLLLPIQRHLRGIERVFVCADDVLAQVPFGALEVAEGHYALEQRSFVNVQDPVSLRRQLESESSRRAAPPSLLAVGGVDYSRRSKAEDSPPRNATAKRGDRGFDREWKQLEHTGTEAAAVQRVVAHVPRGTTLVLRGADATEEAFLRAASGRTVLHLATHGFFERRGVPSLWESALARARDAPGQTPRIDDRIPPSVPVKPLEGEPPGLLAGIVLAGANREPTAGHADGILTADEVSRLRLQDCELVVLSACETALGSARSGEGLISLRRAFAEAGAKTVISTLWQVDDAATRALIERFYAGWLEKKLPAAEALRQAQLWMLRGGSKKDWRSPRYWAAWVVAGEWR